MSIVSPGPALQAVRAWARQTGSIDAIALKPLSIEPFFRTLEDLLRVREATRQSTAKTELLARLVPEAALSVVEGRSDGEAELFEAAVLFTDIRRSTELMHTLPPREFFDLLNQSLSAQAGLIGSFGGTVTKYTGDGVMAVFRGSSRSYMALRCALKLGAMSGGQKMPFGVGVARGLVLAGLLGDSRHTGQRHQYDVIGATVHLAARLCGMAQAGEVVATQDISDAAKVQSSRPRPFEQIIVKGFDAPIDCVAYGPIIDNFPQGDACERTI